MKSAIICSCLLILLTFSSTMACGIQDQAVGLSLPATDTRSPEADRQRAPATPMLGLPRSSQMSSYPLTNRTITIDGLPSDWQGIAPLFTDPKGDTQYAKDDGSDLKAIYAAKDTSMLYLMVEFYSKANASNYLDLHFMESNGTAHHFMFKGDGFISWSKDWETKGVRVGYKDVAEVGFPLTLLADSAILFLKPHVYIPSADKWDDQFDQWVGIRVEQVSTEYEVTAHKSSRLIEITAHVKNLEYLKRSSVLFRFSTHWARSTCQYYLVNLTFSSGGRQLNQQLVDVDVWNVSLPETKQEVIAHYFLNLTLEPPHANYFGEDFIIAYVGSLFIYPDTYALYEMRFRFRLPNGWVAATQWNEENGEVVTRNLEYIKRGFIAIGRYNIHEFRIGGVTLVLAVHIKTKFPPNDLVNYAKSCFSYLIGFLKFPFPDTKKFLVIFPNIYAGTADYCGPSCTVPAMIELFDLDILPHEMFHCLSGIALGILGEGVTEHYAYKALVLNGLWDRDRFFEALTTDKGFRYYTAIWNTKYNLPILSDELNRLKESGDWQYFFVWCSKTILVAYMLDKEISRVTSGSKSLDNVISYLNAKYLDNLHGVSPEEFLQTVNLVSGYDLTAFFNKYLYGSDWLPPTPLRDWFDWYIAWVDRLLVKVGQPDQRILDEFNRLKAECDTVISLIYAEKYQEAFSKVEGEINGFKSLLSRLMPTTTVTMSTTTSSTLTVHSSTSLSTSQQSTTTTTATTRTSTSQRTTTITRFSGSVSTTYTTRTTSYTTSISASVASTASSGTSTYVTTELSKTGTATATSTSTTTVEDTIRLTVQHMFIEKFLERVVSTITSWISELVRITQSLFVTETVSDTTVKVEPLSAERGTSRIELSASPKPGYINKPVNISGVMYGSWRCIRDGVAVGKPVAITAGWGFSTVLTTDYYGRFSVVTNCPSTGGTYPITATFYEDQDLAGNSTTLQYEVIAKIPTSITIGYVGNREFAGYLRRADTGGYLAYKPVRLTVTYLSGTTWQTTTYDLQTRQDGYWSLEFLFYWNRATISFEGDETYAPCIATITR